MTKLAKRGLIKDILFGVIFNFFLLKITNEQRKIQRLMNVAAAAPTKYDKDEVKILIKI